MQIVLLHDFWNKFHRSDNIGLAVFATYCSPRITLCNFFIADALLLRLQFHFFHHLSDDTIGQHDYWSAIAEREFKTKVYEICHFLHTVGRKDNEFVVTITSTASSLIVVTLRRLNGAKSGTTTLNINDEARHFCTSHITNALLHQSNTDTCR